jgi:hypothetical protein
MEELTISISGFKAVERSDLIFLIESTGAKYSGKIII